MSDKAEQGWRTVPVEWKVPVSKEIAPYMASAHSVTAYVDGWCPPNVRDVLAERIAYLLRREVEAAEKREREACAQVCDHWASPRHAADLDLDDSRWKAKQAAAAIRAREGV